LKDAPPQNLIFATFVVTTFYPEQNKCKTRDLKSLNQAINDTNNNRNYYYEIK
jgi:hypothetical protein